MIPASSKRSRFPIAAFFAALAVLPWIGLAPAQDPDLDLPEPGRLKVEDPGSVAPEPGDPGADPLDFDPSPAAIPEPERLSPVPKVEVNPEGKPAAGKTIGTHCVVESDDPEIRSAFSLFADQVGDRYVALLGQPDEFREPIRVILRRAEGGVAPEGTRLSFCQIRQIEGKIRYEVWAQIATGFTKELLHDEIVRMLLARDCLNEVGVAPAGGAIVPDWLRLGVLEAMAMRERGYPTGIFAAMLKSGTFMGVEDLLIADPEPMDSISLAVYRASACAFLLTLIDQTSGPQRLRRFMADLPRDQSSVHALLNKHFPALQTSRESVEKWWALQVATLAQPGALDLLSPLETERQLAAALRFAWTEEIPESERQREAAAAAAEVAEGTEGGEAEGEPAEEAEAGGEKDKPRLSKLFSFFKRKKGDGDGEAEADSGGEAAAPAKEAPKKPTTRRVTCGIDEFMRFAKRKDREAIVAPVERKLQELANRAFPLHQPIITEYREIIARIADGKRRGAEDRIAQLAASRRSIAERSAALDSHLNWYEAQQVPHPSGVFDEYLKAAEESENLQRPKRADAISRYLDDAEALWGGP